MKSLVLAMLVCSLWAQQCTSEQFKFNGNCLDRTCLEKISRIDVSKYKYVILPSGVDQQDTVDINYSDLASNQLVSDPNCLNWRVYQQQDDQIGNITHRNYVNTTEIWPVAAYSFNTSDSTAHITFNITRSDLDVRQCIKSNQIQLPQLPQWNCYFELAYSLNGTTQGSFYFDVVFTTNLVVQGQKVRVEVLAEPPK